VYVLETGRHLPPRSVLVSDPEDLIRTLLEAVSTRDYERQRACLTEHFTMETPFSPPEIPGTHDSPDAFVTALAASDAAFDSKVLEVDEVYRVEGADLVVAVYHTNATTKRGQPFDQQYVGFFWLAGGKVARWREYYDPDVIRRTFKLALVFD
jgi:ketosteroid isomerase-like protein